MTKKMNKNVLITLGIILVALIILGQNNLGGRQVEASTWSAVESYCDQFPTWLVCYRSVNGVERWDVNTVCTTPWATKTTCAAVNSGGGDTCTAQFRCTGQVVNGNYQVEETKSDCTKSYDYCQSGYMCTSGATGTYSSICYASGATCNTLYQCSATTGRYVTKSTSTNCEWTTSTTACPSGTTCTPGTSSSTSLYSVCTSTTIPTTSYLNPHTDMTSTPITNIVVPSTVNGDTVTVKARFNFKKNGYALLEAGLTGFSRTGIPTPVTIDLNQCNPGETWYSNKLVYIEGDAFNGYYADVTFSVKANKGDGIYSVVFEACDKCYSSGGSCYTNPQTQIVTVTGTEAACDAAFECTSVGKYKPIEPPTCGPSGTEQACSSYGVLGNRYTCNVGTQGDSIEEVCSVELCQNTCTSYDQDYCEGNLAYSCDKNAQDCWVKNLLDTCTSDEKCDKGACVPKSQYVTCYKCENNKVVSTSVSGTCDGTTTFDTATAVPNCGSIAGTTVVCDEETQYLDDGECKTKLENSAYCYGNNNWCKSGYCQVNSPSLSNLFGYDTCETASEGQTTTTGGTTTGGTSVATQVLKTCETNNDCNKETEYCSVSLMGATSGGQNTGSLFLESIGLKAHSCLPKKACVNENEISDVVFTTNDVAYGLRDPAIPLCYRTVQCEAEDKYVAKCVLGRSNDEVEGVITDAIPLAGFTTWMQDIFGVSTAEQLGMCVQTPMPFDVCEQLSKINIFNMEDECTGGGLVAFGAVIILLIIYGWYSSRPQPYRRRR